MTVTSPWLAQASHGTAMALRSSGQVMIMSLEPCAVGHRACIKHHTVKILRHYVIRFFKYGDIRAIELLSYFAAPKYYNVELLSC